MNAIWSDEQRRCLDALGYTLYRSAATPALGVDASNGMQDGSLPLLRALYRASNFDPATTADAEEWLRAQQVPSLAQLRNDPAAKRALWPRLRALRRVGART